MDIKHAVPSALPSSWSIPQTVNMKDHARKANWTSQLSPYLRNLKIKNLMASPRSPGSSSSISPSSPVSELEESTFQIIHTPDRPERPVSRTAIPNDEQCMQFLMSLQKQEEDKRVEVKTGLKMWPYPDEEAEDRRCLRSVRVESVHFEKARLARTNSSGPARVVEVVRSSTRSTTATRHSGYLPSPGVSDTDDTDDIEDAEDSSEEMRLSVLLTPLTPPPTLSRSHSRLDKYTPRAQTSRWSDDSESLFSSRDIDSPCPQHGAIRSSVEVSSPTMIDDDSLGPSSPLAAPLLTPVKDRPATPFTEPRLRSASDPTTPPPTDHIVHQISPKSLPKKYSWRSSKETILDSGAPVSRFQSWLPESRVKEPENEQSQQSDVDIYGDWADYYFEDTNFVDISKPTGEEVTKSDGNDVEEVQDAEEKETGDEGEEQQDDEVNEKQKTVHLEIDRETLYPRYESFIKDYKENVMNVTVMEA